MIVLCIEECMHLFTKCQTFRAWARYDKSSSAYIDCEWQSDSFSATIATTISKPIHKGVTPSCTKLLCLAQA